MKRLALCLIPSPGGNSRPRRQFQTLANAQDSGQVASGSAQVVAGAAGLPFILVGASVAAPGMSLAATSYGHNDSLFSVGAVATVPGLVVAAPGILLMKLATDPLPVSPETMTAHPAPKTSPDKPK